VADLAIVIFALEVRGMVERDLTRFGLENQLLRWLLVVRGGSAPAQQTKAEGRKACSQISKDSHDLYLSVSRMPGT
jgi:hypothetical protein